MLRVFVITNDYYLWAMSPFTYLFNKYWGKEQEAVVMGYKLPTFELPSNFRFHSMSRSNYPKNKWSNALIKFLKDMGDEYCVLLLEDYWLSRPVDTHCIQTLHEYMKTRNDILRFDLTGDVLHATGDARAADEVGFIKNYDVVEKIPGKSYRMSYQAGLWNVGVLLTLLKEDKGPWESEIHTHVPDNLKVYGTRQWPVRYVNAIYKGALDIKEINKLSKQDFESVKTSFPDGIDTRNYDKQ